LESNESKQRLNMISFSKIMRRVLTERMSFRDLFRVSDPARVDRSRDVSTKSLQVRSMDGQEAWTFSYKSNPSTSGQRWQGYVRFLKEDVSQKDRADQLDCMVDCTCPDYRFRWAYNNAKQDAGALGPKAWNDNNGQAPKPRSQGGVGDLGPGMCKHLISLGEYLKTNIEPEAPKPEEPEPQAPKPVVKKEPVPAKSTIDAPEPDDSYTDSRSGGEEDSGYSDSRSGDELQEGKGQLAQKLDALVKTKPQFEVVYED
jgi:hypothetical protein